MEALSSDMQRLQARLDAAQAEAAAQKQHAEELQKKLARERSAAASHPLPPHEAKPLVCNPALSGFPTHWLDA